METNKKFRPFDKVLIKDGDSKWQIDLYSHWDSDSENHITMSYGGGLEITDKDILPYEGNEHLVGKTDEPDEEVKLEKGEFIQVFLRVNNLPFDCCLRRFNSIRENRIKAFYDYGNNPHHISVWPYCIKFSDFNPNDMEETKKHILCVKNGKIVRYRE